MNSFVTRTAGIERYIPHRPPMQLVERLVSGEERRVVVASSIAHDNAFFDPALNGVPAWAGIEFMAQTAAVWVGLEDERLGREVRPAFLISSRQYNAFVPVFDVGAELEITVDVSMVEDPVVAFKGRIAQTNGTEGERLLAEAIFSAFRPEDYKNYLSASEPTG
ncbi:ApeP family dehydratase [Gilvimarinus algae]|uniref:Beta-hydroxyacyl-ACP dehydratase n=1 Tax=Gilvimarinus algae TaxID=3058037 RepID=A0ABT8TLG4_9GAMM|nr:hypothetical protein [Gilvimarinus sp. SDUM040014]MDO3383471.1 hypothetical protein [Gilvimarinus sp. SDUM040014]